MNFCNAECSYRKISRVICLCSLTGPRFPETAAPWRPAHSIKATSCKSDVRSRVIHYSSGLMLVGLSRFISIAAPSNLLPNPSIAPLPPEMGGELRSAENKLRREAQPTSPCARPLGLRKHVDHEKTSQRASTHPPDPPLLTRGS